MPRGDVNRDDTRERRQLRAVCSVPFGTEETPEGKALGVPHALLPWAVLCWKVGSMALCCLFCPLGLGFRLWVEPWNNRRKWPGSGDSGVALAKLERET